MSERLVVALRAITSITNFQHPFPRDMVLLRRWAGPGYDDAPNDELARLVIAAEIEKKKDRPAARGTAA